MRSSFWAYCFEFSRLHLSRSFYCARLSVILVMSSSLSENTKLATLRPSEKGFFHSEI